MVQTLQVLDVVLLAVAVWLVNSFIKTKRHPPYPPSPRPFPLIGNLLDMPKSHEWRKFSEWNDQYGEVPCQLSLRICSLTVNAFLVQAT